MGTELSGKGPRLRDLRGRGEMGKAMTCKEAVRYLYPFLDRELNKRKSRAVRTHLDRCRTCCTKFEFESALKALTRAKAREGDVPPRLRQRIARLIETF